ncbi:uncharacterized protein LOC127460923 isoform X3 [Manacus candei]|uniref:uncharacterized protein LOC127460923 isoform X3 n=1 Tax=Manacus candei TaxID=415023 RepID=UPI00222730EC|nr:uncharacterized protein LOC127460923 isoform X3 [Manacus candei]
MGFGLNGAGGAAGIFGISRIEVVQVGFPCGITHPGGVGGLGSAFQGFGVELGMCSSELGWVQGWTEPEKQLEFLVSPGLRLFRWVFHVGLHTQGMLEDQDQLSRDLRWSWERAAPSWDGLRVGQSRRSSRNFLVSPGLRLSRRVFPGGIMHPEGVGGSGSAFQGFEGEVGGVEGAEHRDLFPSGASLIPHPSDPSTEGSGAFSKQLHFQTGFFFLKNGVFSLKKQKSHLSLWVNSLKSLGLSLERLGNRLWDFLPFLGCFWTPRISEVFSNFNNSIISCHDPSAILMEREERENFISWGAKFLGLLWRWGGSEHQPVGAQGFFGKSQAVGINPWGRFVVLWGRIPILIIPEVTFWDFGCVFWGLPWISMDMLWRGRKLAPRGFFGKRQIIGINPREGLWCCGVGSRS